ncbi:ran guanine nucleotide release factor-like [Lineus longissimus]|uniref:ran guanine nucleotide release factor-like n=1 Tax=Lineus longissimus TaxID=88925 RepID=UPI002B4E2ED8
MKRNLFGGAMTIFLPEDVLDASKVRQIPDNQEVFTHSKTDQSMIIEILEYVNEPDQMAIRTHYGDIAGCNDAATDEDTQILHVEQIPKDQVGMSQCQSAWFIAGKQKVAKFHESVKNEVNIHMAVFRLQQYDSDILITFNDPVAINPDSSSHGAIPVSTQPWSIEQFRNSVMSLEIVNEELFG